MFSEKKQQHKQTQIRCWFIFGYVICAALVPELDFFKKPAILYIPQYDSIQLYLTIQYSVFAGKCWFYYQYNAQKLGNICILRLFY